MYACTCRLKVSHKNDRTHTVYDMSRNLCKLNVESNELIGLPPGLLSLPLYQLLVSGNYIHPALWKENCRSPPQVSYALSRMLQHCIGYYVCVVYIVFRVVRIDLCIAHWVTFIFNIRPV